jgi:hypothetical protein
LPLTCGARNALEQGKITSRMARARIARRNGSDTMP